jgi:hypothetical protein
MTIDLSLDRSIAQDFPQAPTPLQHWRNRARMHAQQLKCGDVFGDEGIRVGKSGTHGASDESLHKAFVEDAE